MMNLFVMETTLYILSLYVCLASNKTIRSLLSLSILALFLARPVLYYWCLWLIFNTPSALRGQSGISLSLSALTLICTLLLYFFGESAPRNFQYAITVSKGFTEWCIAFLCSLGYLLYIWCSWWDCFHMFVSFLAI